MAGPGDNRAGERRQTSSPHVRWYQIKTKPKSLLLYYLYGYVVRNQSRWIYLSSSA